MLLKRVAAFRHLAGRAIRRFCVASSQPAQENPKTPDFEHSNIIDGWIKNKEVCLFMKGTMDEPECGYSNAVVDILMEHNMSDSFYVDVMKNTHLKELVKNYTDWPTFPQLYIKGRFIGGADIVYEMNKDGSFKKLLQQLQI